jgi:hypothetical protein
MSNNVRCSACQAPWPKGDVAACPSCGVKARTIDEKIVEDITLGFRANLDGLRKYFKVYWRWYSVSLALVCLTPFFDYIPLPSVSYEVFFSLVVNLLSFAVSFLVGYRVYERLK